MKAKSGSRYVLAAVTLSARASPPAFPPTAPAADLSEPLASAAPAKTVLYTDCIAQAISANKVSRQAETDKELIRFTYSGASAQRFYEAPAVFGDDAVSVGQADGRNFRAIAKVKEDLFGVDYCSARAGGAVCHIVLKAGSSLTAPP